MKNNVIKNQDLPLNPNKFLYRISGMQKIMHQNQREQSMVERN